MDINEIPSLKGQVSEEEWQLRVDLAACYRVIAMYGWDDLIFTHASARVPGETHQFLINPYGLLFEEMTASSLVLVDQSCNKQRDNPFPVNPAGFVIHSAIHEARPEAQCVLHTHTVEGVAVSAQKAGLLAISQQSTVALIGLGYHDYEGIALRKAEKPRLCANLGENNALILRNHGLLTVGTSIPNAFLTMYILQKACEIQVLAQAGGELTKVNPEILGRVKEDVSAVTKGMGGALAWPGLLRKLDRVNPGYRR